MNARAETGASTAEGDLQKNDTKPQGAKALNGGKDRLLSDLRVVIKDAQTLLEDAVKLSAESVPAYLEDRARSVKDNLQRARSTMEEKVKRTTAATGKYVRENPWKSIGYVSAASVLLSLLLVRACSHDLGKTGSDIK